MTLTLIKILFFHALFIFTFYSRELSSDASVNTTILKGDEIWTVQRESRAAIDYIDKIQCNDVAINFLIENLSKYQ